MDTLYKVIIEKQFQELTKNSKICFGNRNISFTKDLSFRHGEFGDYVLEVDRSIFLKSRIFEIRYNLDWLIKNHLLKKITGRNVSDWINVTKEDYSSSISKEKLEDENVLYKLINDEIEELYSWEQEVVVKRLGCILIEDIKTIQKIKS